MMRLQRYASNLPLYLGALAAEHPWIQAAEPIVPGAIQRRVHPVRCSTALIGTSVGRAYMALLHLEQGRKTISQAPRASFTILTPHCISSCAFY